MKIPCDGHLSCFKSFWFYKPSFKNLEITLTLSSLSLILHTQCVARFCQFHLRNMWCASVPSCHLHCHTPTTSDVASCISFSLASLTSLLPSSSHSSQAMNVSCSHRKRKANYNVYHFPPIRLSNFKNFDNIVLL